MAASPAANPCQVRVGSIWRHKATKRESVVCFKTSVRISQDAGYQRKATIGRLCRGRFCSCEVKETPGAGMAKHDAASKNFREACSWYRKPRWRFAMYMYLHIYIYIHTHIYMCVCANRNTYIQMYVRTYVHTYIHTYIHMCPARGGLCALSSLFDGG